MFHQPSAGLLTKRCCKLVSDQFLKKLVSGGLNE
jgi:hypothetical protein